MQRRIIIGLSLLCLLSACGKDVAIDYDGPTDNWPRVGHDASGQRFSPLTQINTDNVEALEVAWRYNHGDYAPQATDKHGPTAFQATPIVVEDTLFFCTPYNRVIALDPETGEERWTHDPEVDLTGVYTPTCRGVSYRRDPQRPAGSTCASQIFTGTLDARLIALDARTGERCSDFGDNGEVDLLKGLGDVQPGEYYMTSPPLVFEDRVVTGAYVQDGERVNAPSGAIRAFDARSGELVWVWDPVAPPLKPVTAEDIRNGATLSRGTPNAWGLLSADFERNLIFIPTGNPSTDHFAGEQRRQREHYGSSVVALDAATGEANWRFQTVHHDVWDYDLGAQPSTYRHRGETPAVIAATKMGHIFMLDQRDGSPLFPVEERPVPQTDVPGEWTSPTQPFPTRPEPLHPADLDREDIWGILPWDKQYCREFYDRLRYDGIFTPPSLEGTLAYPGLGGGINWGGVSINPRNNTMVVNLQIAPFTMKLVPREEYESDGKGGDQVGLNPQHGTPYVIKRGVFATEPPDMRPCVEPPWGKLVAIDLDSGEIRWERPLGNLNKLAPMGVGRFFEWGTPNTGGSIQTAGGLTFIGATMDHYFRAFDVTDGEELWRFELPYAAHATPMTYRLDNDSRQYVVIAAGGHASLGSPPGDALIAFALPESEE